MSMIDGPVSGEELDQILEPIPAADRKLFEGCVGWPMVIDFQTLCQRLIGYGFTEFEIAVIKAALLEAELAYRYYGKRKGVET